jgi:hypothetical protein
LSTEQLWTDLRKYLTKRKERQLDSTLKDNVSDIEAVLSIKTNLVEQMTKELEILYAIGEDGKESIFVKQKGGQNE